MKSADEMCTIIDQAKARIAELTADYSASVKLCELGQELIDEAAIHLQSAEAEITRLNTALRYEQDRSGRIGTHGPGCESWGPRHYECATEKLSATIKVNTELEAENARWVERHNQARAEVGRLREALEAAEYVLTRTARPNNKCHDALAIARQALAVTQEKG
jgi:DNA repair exonuclease SbcCD ATPase subunit